MDNNATNNHPPEDSKNKVIIYTDGACKGNPGIGGWGAFLTFGSVQKTLSGGEQNTTNNRMELTATIEALSSLKRNCLVELWTDSNYVKNGITSWIENWKKNGWKTASKKPVVNQDLWKQLDELNAQHTVDWRWVKGHNGNPGNEMADRLANEGIEKAW